MLDAYYQLARSLETLDRAAAAAELRKLHQQAVDQVQERVLNILGQAIFEGWTVDEVREDVRKIRISGAQFADDRIFLRRCEAMIFALRTVRTITLLKKDVAAAFDNGDGIEVGTLGTALEIEQHPGKFSGR